MVGPWYSQSIAQTEAALRTDLGQGLDRRQVKARRQKRGANDIFALPRQSYRSYLSHLLTDIPTILLFLTVLIAVIFEQRITLLSSLFFLITGLLAAVAAYVRAETVLERMGDRALPGAKVMREGKLFLIKQKHLVQGDIIFLSRGDIVPCDARLVEAEDVEVLETNLTTVPHAVGKNASFIGQGDLPIAGQKNMVFASTILTAGRAKAIVCEVGADTLVCKMEKNKPIVTRDNLPILTTLRQISRIWSVCMMILIFALTAANLVLSASSASLLDTFLTALSLSVAAMSEYYMPFGFMIVACGIYAAVRKYHDISSGAMIKDIGKLDTLRKVDCLIVPMEGVFTAQDLRIDAVYANGDLYETDHVAFAKNATRTIRFALLSTALYGAEALRKNNISGNNVYSPEEDAIIRAAERISIYHTELEARYPLIEHRGIGSMNEMETSIVRHDGKRLVALRGGVMQVLSRCTHICIDGRIQPLDRTMRNELINVAASMGRRSLRVLAIASGETEYDRIVRPSSVQCNLVFEGFLGIHESMLSDVARMVQKCRENGISVLIMAEEENENDVSFAKTLGLIDGSDQVLTGSQASKMKEGIFRINVERYRLFLGLNIAQKRLLVRSLQDAGMTVGFLADQLEEILLCREANVGFAQSVTIAEGAGRFGVDMTSRRIPVFNRGGKNRIGGCEALKFVADVVISEANREGDGGFHAILLSLLCAKSIFRNLHRAISYLLTTQTARLGLLLLSFVSGTPVLSPTQILYTGLIVDFLGVLMIAFSPITISLLSRPAPSMESETKPSKLLMPHIGNVLIGLLWAVMAACLPFVLTRTGLTLTSAQMMTMTFFSFSLTQGIALLGSGQAWKWAFRPLRINRITLTSILSEIGFLSLCALTPFGYWMDCVSLPIGAWAGVVAIPLLLLTVYLFSGGIVAGRGGHSSESHSIEADRDGETGYKPV